VVQLVVPAVSDCDPVTTGATLAMSGATTRLASAVESRIVSVRAARGDDQQVAAELVDLVAHLGLRALAQPDCEHHRSDADEDAQHGQ